MFPTRKLVDYLCKEYYLELQCSFCYSVSLDILVCSGPCQKRICKQCINQIAVNNYICRCSYCSNEQIFQWKTIIDKKIEFICPYTLDMHKQIKSAQSFQNHCFNCQFMTQKDKQLAKCLQNYQCNNGHTLVYMSQDILKHLFPQKFFFATISNSQCEICKQIVLCRSYCPICSENKNKQIFYCKNCRMIPVSKVHCPIGHTLVQKKHRNLSSICDLCGQSERFSTNFAYSDRNCNLDICFSCYSKLPQQNQLKSLKKQYQLLKTYPIIQSQ